MLPPPAFDYDEMLFSVSIRDGSGKEIVSDVWCGDQLETLQQDGYSEIFLDQPIIIGTVPAAPAGAYAGYAERDEVYENWSVTVHLFRLDQNKCCCVHSSGSWNWQVAEILTDVDPAHTVVGWVNSFESAALELDERGTLLEGRIQELDLGGDEFLGIQFYVNLKCCVQEQAPPHPNDPSARTVVLELGEVHLVALRVNPDGADFDYFVEAEVQQHGVTLPHLLEHLKGWGDPDD
jgi:hypothetical protein